MAAGFPLGRPGRAEEIEGATQQAAQPGRQSKGGLLGSIAALLFDREKAFLSPYAPRRSRPGPPSAPMTR